MSVCPRCDVGGDMAKTEERLHGTEEVYSLTGTLIEACSCSVLCPCWIGEDPDLGDCRAILAYHVDDGRVGGLDVSGPSFVSLAYIPGTVLAWNWEIVALVDDNATDEQREALLAVFTGEKGGPMADFAQLIGKVKGVESAPITHQVVGGVGTIVIPGIVESEMEPYRSPAGTVTTLRDAIFSTHRRPPGPAPPLRDSIFSTVPGSPAWVSKATKHRVSFPKYGFEWEFEGRNA